MVELYHALQQGSPKGSRGKEKLLWGSLKLGQICITRCKPYCKGPFMKSTNSSYHDFDLSMSILAVQYNISKISVNRHNTTIKNYRTASYGTEATVQVVVKSWRVTPARPSLHFSGSSGQEQQADKKWDEMMQPEWSCSTAVLAVLQNSVAMWASS